MKKLWNFGWDLYKKHEEGINYLIFGFLAFVANMFVYWLVASLIGASPETPLLVQIATGVAWVSSVIFTYWTNHTFVFKTKLHSFKEFVREFSSFVTARVITYGMEIILMYILPTVIGMDDLLAKLISNFVVIVSNYIFSKLFVFKKK